MTLDQNLRTTKEGTQMKYGATRNSQGLWENRSTDFLLTHLIRIISNPGSPEEAININSAIKCLTIKQHGTSADFYKILSEGLNRRMIFQKLSQIMGPLSDEIEVNSEFLMMLINNELLTMRHLEELSSFQDRNFKIAHYLIHNVNNYHRLSVFLFCVQNWCRDTNLIELMEDISFEMEIVQSQKLQQKVDEDITRKLCLIY